MTRRLTAAAALAAALLGAVPAHANAAPRWNCGDGPECYVIAVACLTLPEKYRPACELG